MKRRTFRGRPFVLAALLAMLPACDSSTTPEVVIYTSLDQTLSEEILADFQERTGVTVRAVYDTEASKTTGLVNRLLAEKDHPRADVFWNSEAIRTIVLEHRGVLAPYDSPAAGDIPPRFRDPEGYWTGFAARIRVLICNTDTVPAAERPSSIFDLTEPRWKGRFVLANPLFGTTATHAAVLFSSLGRECAEQFFDDLDRNDVTIVAGNATAKDSVASGEYDVGFTDSDDVMLALRRGSPVEMIIPDQDGMGTLLIPNTVALINGGPNPEHGRALIDYLLSPEVETRLARASGGQIPLRSGLAQPEHLPRLEDMTIMDVDFEAAAMQLESSSTFVRELFLH